MAAMSAEHMMSKQLPVRRVSRHACKHACACLRVPHPLLCTAQAPKTFAPSREDVRSPLPTSRPRPSHCRHALSGAVCAQVLSNLAFFFGDPAVPGARVAQLYSRSSTHPITMLTALPSFAARREAQGLL